jgi:hypothetical protein
VEVGKTRQWDTARAWLRFNYKKCEATGFTSVARKPGSGGHNRVELNGVAKKIIKKCALGTGGSVRKCAAMLNANGVLIGRDKVRKELNKLLSFEMPIRLCKLTDQMKIDRFNFAAEWLAPKHYGPVMQDRRSAKLLAKIKRWVFTDEKSFYTFGNNTRRAGKWVEIGSKYTIESHKCQQSKFHVWGGISHYGKTKLHIFEGIMDADKYIEICKKCLLPEMKKHKDFMMVEDGDPKHSMNCGKTKAWFEENGLKHRRILNNTPADPDAKRGYKRKGSGGKGTIWVETRIHNEQMCELGRWPANSPELNAIELVWAWIENTLNREYEPIYNKKKLMKTVQKLWEDYPIKAHQKKCVSFDDMLWKLVTAEGGHICAGVRPHT